MAREGREPGYRGDVATRIGDQVKFRVANVFLWSPEEPLSALPPDAEVYGAVTGFSDSGSEPLLRVSLSVEVVRKQSVIVRLDDLETIG